MSRVQPPHSGERDGALLLLGHGSDHSPASAHPIRMLARELQHRKCFGEVKLGFWKEKPYLHEALWRVQAREVVVVPIFTSEGHYTKRVIPRELGLDEQAARPPGLAVYLSRPVGAHPGIAEVILDRARAATRRRMRDGELPMWAEARKGKVALVIVGHGTPRHPDSSGVTHRVARAVRARWSHGPVAAAFLDEAPTVPRVIGQMDVASAVVVPFFISEGWHAGVTLPRSLAVEGGRGRLGETAIRYTPPVGTHPSIADLVVDLASDGFQAMGAARDSAVPATGLDMPGRLV